MTDGGTIGHVDRITRERLCGFVTPVAEPYPTMLKNVHW
jgi:hypothetical protein